MRYLARVGSLVFGVGAQCIHFQAADGVPAANTPFLAIDGVLGHRL